MNEPITIRRAQIRHRNEPGHVDVTARSAPKWARPFAPPWAIVREYKAGTIGEREYTQRYNRRLVTSLMSAAGEDALDGLLALGRDNGGVVTLCCYCADGEFCHTVLLALFLAKHFSADFRTDLRIEKKP